MGNEQAGNCYNATDKDDKRELIENTTRLPTDSPMNAESMIMNNPSNPISKVNMDFDPNENEVNDDPDPLSKKDPDEVVNPQIFKKKKKKTIIYKGYFMNDKFEGEGVFQFKNGDWFKGIFWKLVDSLILLFELNFFLYL
jgi:hypothetical protein